MVSVHLLALVASLPASRPAPAAPVVVSLKTETSSTSCAARRVLLQTLRQVPAVRARWVKGGSNADAVFTGDTWQISLGDRQGRARRFLPALRQAWPPQWPPLPSGLVPPPYRILATACADDIDRAYRHSGVAVPPALAVLAPPPERRGQDALLRRWAFARGRLTSGQHRAALSHLKAVVQGLEKGHRGPTWRRIGRRGHEPTITLIDDRLVLFDDGVFEAFDLATGRPLWTQNVGTAEPHPVALGDALTFVVDDGIRAIDGETGQPRWQVALREPHPEIEVDAERLYVADLETITAIDRKTGEVKWQYDGLHDPVAGPVRTAERLAAPIGAKIVLLSPEDGVEEAVIELADELSAPLTVGPKGEIWALVGSDEISYIPPGGTEVAARAQDVSGIEWPPTLLPDALLFVGTDRRDRTGLIALDPTTVRVLNRVPSVAAPVYPLRSGMIHAAAKNRALVSRAASGDVRWRIRTEAQIASWTVADDSVVAAQGDTVYVYDGKDGRKRRRIDIGRSLSTVVYARQGGIAVAKNGILFGLPPFDDRAANVLLQDARLALAQAQAQVGRRTAALKTAAQAVMGGDRDLEARLLMAEIETRQRRGSAMASWLAVMSDPAASPEIVARAQEGAARAGGLTAVLSLGAQQARVTQDRLIVRTPDKVEGRDLFQPEQILWSRPAAEVGGLRAGLIEIGEGWHRVADGQPVAQPPPLSPILQLRTSTSGVLVEGVSPEGVQWSRLRPSALGLVRPTAEFAILYGTGGAALWSMADGETLWQRTRPAPTREALFVDPVVLLRTEGGLHGLRTKDGRQAYRISVDDEAKVFADVRQVIITDDKTLRVVDVERGRLKGRIELSAPVARGWWAAGRLYVALADATLTAIDTRRRRQLGQLSVGVRDGSAAGDVLAIVDDQGRLLLFDARRGLRP